MLAGLADRLEQPWGWDDIVLPDEALAQLRDICRRVLHKRQVLDGWGMGRKLPLGRGVAALFAGPSGTGKTMAAAIVGRELGLDVYRIDLSRVVSKYIGETEKNLGRVFDAAEQANVVLLFDEADALFGKRSEVKDAHDRYANIEIGYLLQRMEAYPGTTILATNLRHHLDEAFLRRLQVVVEFPMPAEADRLRLWRKMFPPEAPLAADVDVRGARPRGAAARRQHPQHRARRGLCGRGRGAADRDRGPLAGGGAGAPQARAAVAARGRSGMIRDLSETLAALLSAPDLPEELREALVSFEHPIDTFNPDRPTLNLFLYELKENRELRSNEPIVRRQNGNALIRRPAVRVDCYYLLTAWPGDQTGSEGALRGHRLLESGARGARAPPDDPGGRAGGPAPRPGAAAADAGGAARRAGQSGGVLVGARQPAAPGDHAVRHGRDGACSRPSRRRWSARGCCGSRRARTSWRSTGGWWTRPGTGCSMPGSSWSGPSCGR